MYFWELFSIFGLFIIYLEIWFCVEFWRLNKDVNFVSKRGVCSCVLLDYLEGWILGFEGGGEGLVFFIGFMRKCFWNCFVFLFFWDFFGRFVGKIFCSVYGRRVLGCGGCREFRFWWCWVCLFCLCCKFVGCFDLLCCGFVVYFVEFGFVVCLVFWFVWFGVVFFILEMLGVFCCKY